MDHVLVQYFSSFVKLYIIHLWGCNFKFAINYPRGHGSSPVQAFVATALVALKLNREDHKH